MFHHICNAQRNIHYYTKILVATILTFAMVALHAYDFMSVQAASCVALYMYFFGANHKGSLSELVRKLLPGICVTTVAVIIGLLLVIILHLQIVSFDDFLRNTTRRSIDLVNNYPLRVDHYRPSILTVFIKSAVPLLLMFVIPVLLIFTFVKEQSKWLLMIVLLLPVLGGLLWQILFPEHRNHVEQFEQSLYYGMLPMLLLVASHPDINQHMSAFLQKLLK